MTGNPPKTTYLFDHWSSISKLIRANKRLVICLDFDGTLVRIAPKPDLVSLTSSTRRILKKLATHPAVTMAVISGRQRAELQSYIGIPNIDYLGLYGWESNGNTKLSPEIRAALRRTRTELTAELKAYPGVWIETKRHSFSIHLMGTSEEVQKRVRRKVSAQLKPLGDTLRVMRNLRDMEVAPASVHGKGAAIRKILAQNAVRATLPIYFGDDLSDEPAFDAVRKGVSILVGERHPTRAQFYLRTPAEVTTALSRMAAMLA